MSDKDDDLMRSAAVEAGYASLPDYVRDNANLLAKVTMERDRATNALRATLQRYVELASSGDCGFWDCELEAHVIEARAVLARPHD